MTCFLMMVEQEMLGSSDVRQDELHLVVSAAPMAR